MIRKIEELFATPKVEREDSADGTIYLRSAAVLGDYPARLGDWLEHWAQMKPESVFMAERDADGDGWNTLGYRDMLTRVRQVAGWILASGASLNRPLAILSENSLDHAVLAFGAMHAGVPVATISTAYSLQSSDRAKLKEMVALLDPAVVFVSDTAIYDRALSAIRNMHSARLLASSDGVDLGVDLIGAIGPEYDGEAVNRAYARVGPDTVARLLFTSGSTGLPKAVKNTHRMLTSNQAAHLAVCPGLVAQPPRLVDWLPWSHTFGANFTTNTVLCTGGSVYLDDGKPAPQLIGKTVRNIKEIAPSIIYNVPRGFDLMVAELERDAEFREVFFSAEYLFYAAAALPKTTWDRLIELSIETTGRAIPLVAAWGSTETAPLATYCHFQSDVLGNVGVPIPGAELKLVESGDKLEVRVRGPLVTPGYFKNDAVTRQAFDEEGFYLMGDAMRCADPQNPSKGLFFDGRVSEDFKLTSGTWVSVGQLRLAGIDALAPVAQDIVVTGHDRDYVGFLVFPNEAACRSLSCLTAETPLTEILNHPKVRACVAGGLTRLKVEGGGSSRYAARARFLGGSPNPDTGEITDKAYLNQRQVLKNRAGDVEALYGQNPTDFITLLPENA